jgi:hypothetical protein
LILELRYISLAQMSAFNDYTQPMTTGQINAGREFRGQSPNEPHVPSTPIDDGPNPGEMELDWLAINREFS